MEKRQMKRLIVIVAGILLALWGCAGKEQGAQLGNPGVRVTFFDVGKGDAILIETKGQNMLIDTGYDDTDQVILQYLARQKIKKLDYLAITHFDKDHVGGADKILAAVEVGKVLQPGYESDSRQYREYCEALEEKGMCPQIVADPLAFTLGDAQLLAYPPCQEEYQEQDNDFSLVISMKYKDRSFLFTGDCERERLEELLAQTDFGLAHDVLKVPHHGRKEKNSEEFLGAVAPRAAVITCSEEKMADEEVLLALENLGADIYFTYQGSVAILCDGDTISVVQ